MDSVKHTAARYEEKKDNQEIEVPAAFYGAFLLKLARLIVHAHGGLRER